MSISAFVRNAEYKGDACFETNSDISQTWDLFSEMSDRWTLDNLKVTLHDFQPHCRDRLSFFQDTSLHFQPRHTLLFRFLLCRYIRV